MSMCSSVLRSRLRRYTTQFSLWCIAKAVLLLGCDLSAPLIANGTAADFYEIVSRHSNGDIWVAFSPSGLHSSQDGS